MAFVKIKKHNNNVVTLYFDENTVNPPFKSADAEGESTFLANNLEAIDTILPLLTNPQSNIAKKLIALKNHATESKKIKPTVMSFTAFVVLFVILLSFSSFPALLSTLTFLILYWSGVSLTGLVSLSIGIYLKSVHQKVKVLKPETLPFEIDETATANNSSSIDAAGNSKSPKTTWSVPTSSTDPSSYKRMASGVMSGSSSQLIPILPQHKPPKKERVRVSKIFEHVFSPPEHTLFLKAFIENEKQYNAGLKLLEPIVKKLQQSVPWFKYYIILANSNFFERYDSNNISDQNFQEQFQIVISLFCQNKEINYGLFFKAEQIIISEYEKCEQCDMQALDTLYKEMIKQRVLTDEEVGILFSHLSLPADQMKTRQARIKLLKAACQNSLPAKTAREISSLLAQIDNPTLNLPEYAKTLEEFIESEDQYFRDLKKLKVVIEKIKLDPSLNHANTQKTALIDNFKNAFQNAFIEKNDKEISSLLTEINDPRSDVLENCKTLEAFITEKTEEQYFQVNENFKILKIVTDEIKSDLNPNNVNTHKLALINNFKNTCRNIRNTFLDETETDAVSLLAQIEDPKSDVLENCNALETFIVEKISKQTSQILENINKFKIVIDQIKSNPSPNYNWLLSYVDLANNNLADDLYESLHHETTKDNFIKQLTKLKDTYILDKRLSQILGIEIFIAQQSKTDAYKRLHTLFTQMKADKKILQEEFSILSNSLIKIIQRTAKRNELMVKIEKLTAKIEAALGKDETIEKQKFSEILDLMNPFRRIMSWAAATANSDLPKEVTSEALQELSQKTIKQFSETRRIRLDQTKQPEYIEVFRKLATKFNEYAKAVIEQSAEAAERLGIHINLLETNLVTKENISTQIDDLNQTLSSIIKIKKDRFVSNLKPSIGRQLGKQFGMKKAPSSPLIKTEVFFISTLGQVYTLCDKIIDLIPAGDSAIKTQFEIFKKTLSDNAKILEPKFVFPSRASSEASSSSSSSEPKLAP